MRTILYARVSTKDQKLDHQATQAEQAGFKIDEVVADHGVSGVNTPLADRPQGRRLFDLLRHGDVLVVRWLDRLGRSYDDVTATMRRFLDQGITVRTVINDMTFDGTPSNPTEKAVRDAQIAFMAAMAQAQAEANKEAQRAGIENARAHVGKFLGRKPVYTRAQFEEARALLGQGVPVYQIAKKLGVSRPTIDSIRDDPDKAVAVLKKWELWE